MPRPVPPRAWASPSPGTKILVNVVSDLLSSSISVSDLFLRCASVLCLMTTSAICHALESALNFTVVVNFASTSTVVTPSSTRPMLIPPHQRFLVLTAIAAHRDDNTSLVTPHPRPPSRHQLRFDDRQEMVAIGYLLGQGLHIRWSGVR